MLNIDSEMLRKVFNKDWRRDTVVRPVVASIEIIVIYYPKYLLLQYLRNIEAFTTFAAGKVDKPLSFSEVKAFR